MDEVYKRWKCENTNCKNYDKYCWVDIDDKHYTLTAQDCSRWAKAIPEHATIDRPSDRLRSHLVKQQIEKKKDSNVQTTTSSHGNTINNFHLALPTNTPYFSRQYKIGSSPDQTPTGRHRSSHRMPSTSPAHSDPNSYEEVDRYFEWLDKKYPADKAKFQHAKDQLHERDIDLKTLRKLDNDILVSWSISWGIAAKIRRDIKQFQEEDIY